MRFFNTAGPNIPEDHYTLPPLSRFDLAEVERLIARKRYFVLHAPRQSGKTTALLALRDRLNSAGTYRCVYANAEVGQSAREDVDAAMRTLIGEIALEAEFTLGDRFVYEHSQEALTSRGGHGALAEVLGRWAGAAPKPLVLLLDEVDALVGDSLIALLRQLRAGYARRPRGFPQSIILCGVRDVRDYRIHSRADRAIVTGGSAFNIKTESLRLGDLSEDEVQALYAQHTAATGQVFEPEALARVWALTQGQPWLTNALGYELCFRNEDAQDRSRPITGTLVDAAKEALILRRDTHLDQLSDKLQEERVRRVIEPILAGREEAASIPSDDLQYVADLGLIRLRPQVTIANAIYREIIPRELVFSETLTISHPTAWYVRGDGTLDLRKLLSAFQQFFREHSEHWVERFQYKEAGPQLLMQAFLQRVVNGGGRIEREYGLGHMRTDLLVLWPHPAGEQRAVIELKLLHQSLETTVAQGLTQARAYMDRCGAAEGHLVIFDRRPGRSWEEKVFRREADASGRSVTIWGM